MTRSGAARGNQELWVTMMVMRKMPRPLFVWDRGLRGESEAGRARNLRFPRKHRRVDMIPPRDLRQPAEIRAEHHTRPDTCVG
jgi:hypothetical protein